MPETPMKTKTELIRSVYRILHRCKTDLEIAFDLLHLFQEENSMPLLEEIKQSYSKEKGLFLSHISSVRTIDDFLITFYRTDNSYELNRFILAHLKSETVKQYLMNQQNNRLLARSPMNRIFTQDRQDSIEVLSISGDIFTESQQILRQVSYQHSFIFLWKHFVYLFGDQLNHENLAVWISSFALLKEGDEPALESFLGSYHPNPFRDLILASQGDLAVENLLAFLYGFWPIVLICPESFFTYTTHTLAPYIKNLDSQETLRFISKMQRVDIYTLIVDPRVCLRNKHEITYEASHFHQIFLNISEEERQQGAQIIGSFITLYTEKALPLVLKYKTMNSWRSYAEALSFAQSEDLLREPLIRQSFSYKLLQESFWQSFEEILNFQPFQSIRTLTEESKSLLPTLLSEHIYQGRKTWGSSWFGFYVKVANAPQSTAFQGFLRYFETLSTHVQSHKLIYYMSSVSLPEYNHFLFIYQVLAFLNIIDNPNNKFELIQDPKERELLKNLSRRGGGVDWLNSSIIIRSLERRQTLLEYLMSKVTVFSPSDLEFFDPYSPVLLWLLFKSDNLAGDTTIIHAQRAGFLLYLNYWRDLNSAK